MFRISIVEAHGQRRLVLEGKLVPPWTVEVENAWRNAGAKLQDGEAIVIDLTNVTLISRDGENMLLKMMRDGENSACDAELGNSGAVAHMEISR